MTSILASAADLIRDPARHTTKSDSIDAAGNACAGSTPEAVAWSVYGAVNHVTVTRFNSLDRMDEWRQAIHGLRAMGAAHATPHDESLRMLEAAMRGRPT